MSQKDESGVVRIYRFDPGSGTDPEYREYEVPFKDFTVLQVLEYVYEHYDRTLAFRFGCDGSGSARCGACVVEVNDVPVLACRKQASKNMIVNPHHKFKIIKDLVVDFMQEGESPDD